VPKDQEDIYASFRFTPTEPLRFDTAITAPTAPPPADLSSFGIPIAQESPSSGIPEATWSILTPYTELSPSTLSRNIISVSPSPPHQLATPKQTPNPGSSFASSRPPALPTGLNPANIFPEGSLRRKGTQPTLRSYAVSTVVSQGHSIPTNKTASPGFGYLPTSILDAFIPGYSVISEYLLKVFGFDISIIVSILVLGFACTTGTHHIYRNLLASFLTYFTASVVVNCHDTIYDNISSWAAEQQDLKRVRSLRVQRRG
jgi:hypothetical protein